MHSFKTLLPALWVFGIVPAAWAAGAYVVDDASIVEAGQFQSESWYTHGGRGTDIGVINLTDQIFPDTEFGLQTAHAFRTGGANTIGPQIKYAWYKSEQNRLSVSPVLGMFYATFQSRSLNPYTYVPVTFEATPDLELDADLGWTYDNQSRHQFLTWGLRENYQLAKLLSFGSDIFGRNIKNPGFQLGPHFTASENLEFDLLFGRNVYGLEENSGTAGMTLRF